jgi:hypothetical protein
VYYECLPTRLNPLAERTCFSQVDVPIEGQQFRSENTFVTVSKVSNKQGAWREGLPNGFIGPVSGVSSTVGLEHTLRAELSAEGAISHGRLSH